MNQTSLTTQRLKDVLGNEIVYKKLLSLERVDLVCAYIKISGFKELKPFFQALATHEPPMPVRIFTTSQLGISDPEAIHQLALLPNVEIKVFKASNPTFHAKGWLFVHHGEIPDIAIVGSSNISKPAINTGLEWNIYTTAEPVVTEFKNVFESYWLGKHSAFDKSNVLDYDLKTCEWKSLSRLFPSKVELTCNGSTGSCGHFECQKLSQELSRLERQKDQIVNNFINRSDEGSRERAKASSSCWDLPQDTRSSKPIDVIDDAQEDSPDPPEDLMEVDGDPQMDSTSNSFLADFYRAVFESDERTAEMTIKMIEQLSLPIYWPMMFPTPFLRRLKEAKGVLHWMSTIFIIRYSSL